MRLIHASSRVQHEFMNDTDIPPYAILSHTWGEEEVTFQDYQNGNTAKKGYLKIDLLCKQAIIDGLEFVWVDTANIDKTSSSELSEAINSMWMWYKKAQICYAFIEDADTVDDFGASRWFTRGWTLQELISSQDVNFFGRAWKCLGDRSSLSHRISETTGIDPMALESSNAYRGFSIATRMSWAAHRKTTRTEDIAYCLMGLFDINMPVLYGEGSKAFARLQHEIIRTSGDETIFAWNRKALSDNASLPLAMILDEWGSQPAMAKKDHDLMMLPLSGHAESALAVHPSDFKTHHPIVPLKSSPNHKPHSLTNQGLQIHVRFLQERINWDKVTWCILNCRFEGCLDGYVALPLRETDSPDTFHCRWSELYVMPEWKALQSPFCSIYLSISNTSSKIPEVGRAVCVVEMDTLRTRGFVVSHNVSADAKGCWNPDTLTSEVIFNAHNPHNGRIYKTITRHFLFKNKSTKEAFAITTSGEEYVGNSNKELDRSMTIWYKVLVNGSEAIWIDDIRDTNRYRFGAEPLAGDEYKLNKQVLPPSEWNKVPGPSCKITLAENSSPMARIVVNVWRVKTMQANVAVLRLRYDE